MNRSALILLVLFLSVTSGLGQQKRARDHGIVIGILPTGPLNAITDIKGVRVGHTTIVRDSARTGVTAIIPHPGNVFQDKVPAAVFVGNGFGKLAGSTQIAELGNLETPIILTNTLAVATAIDALITYTLGLPGNEEVRSVNAVVGETNDGYLNDIRSRPVTQGDVIAAIENAGARVTEGNVGAGTGTVCFGFKGGIGTASRVLPESAGGYSVGVIVQTNFGGVLSIDGVAVGKALRRYYLRDAVDGSCMIVVATDAPLDARNLERLAKRAFMGLAKTGGIASNGSGDYVIAFSTHPDVRIPHQDTRRTQNMTVLRNDHMSPLFLAAIEATEEAIINSLFMAESMTGYTGNEVEAIPVDQVIKIMKKHRALK
jgi:D-aminopeptidase